MKYNIKDKELREFAEKQDYKLKIINGAYGKDCPPGIVKEKIQPETGGIFHKLWGCDYLYKNYPYQDLNERLMVSKAALMAGLRIIRKYPFILLGLMFNGFKEELKDYLRIAYRPIKKYILKPNRYCRVCRELNRVASEMIEDDDINRLKEILLMTLEYDNAYRFRFQDMAMELNEKDFQNNPSKEISRVLDILISREHNSERMKKRWKMFKFFAFIFILFNKQKVKEFMKRIDISELYLEPSDHYFALMIEKYDICGATFEQRKALRELINKQRGHKIPEFVKKK